VQAMTDAAVSLSIGSHWSGAHVTLDHRPLIIRRCRGQSRGKKRLQLSDLKSWDNTWCTAVLVLVEYTEAGWFNRNGRATRGWFLFIYPRSNGI